MYCSENPKLDQHFLREPADTGSEKSHSSKSKNIKTKKRHSKNETLFKEVFFQKLPCKEFFGLRHELPLLASATSFTVKSQEQFVALCIFSGLCKKAFIEHVSAF